MSVFTDDLTVPAAVLRKLESRMGEEGAVLLGSQVDDMDEQLRSGYAYPASAITLANSARRTLRRLTIRWRDAAGYRGVLADLPRIVVQERATSAAVLLVVSRDPLAPSLSLEFIARAAYCRLGVVVAQGQVVITESADEPVGRHSLQIQTALRAFSSLRSDQ